MKRPSKQMKRALAQLREWAKGWGEKTEKEAVTWINAGSARIPLLPGPEVPKEAFEMVKLIYDQAERATGVDRVDVRIGESLSWHLGSDKDGNAVRIYHEDEDAVRKFYKRWNPLSD